MSNEPTRPPGGEPYFGLLGAPGSPRAWRFFEVGFRPWMRRKIHAVHLASTADGAVTGEAGPLLVVANHTSWYDGFLLREFHRRLRPEGPLRFVMLRRVLAGSRTLRWIGGTGFDPERPASLRGALRELNALRDQDPTVIYFPQGSIFPATRRPLGFRPGVELVMRQLAPLTVLPVAIHLEMGRHPTPSAWMLAGTPQRVGANEETDTGAPAGGPLPPAPTAAVLEDQVQGLLNQIRHHLETHGEEAESRWPPAPDRPEESAPVPAGASAQHLPGS